MLQNRISGLPVVDTEGNLVGMVTEGDFLRRGEIGTQRRRPEMARIPASGRAGLRKNTSTPPGGKSKRS